MARSTRERTRGLEERMRESAAAQVESIYAAMSVEELAFLLFPPKGRTQAESGAVSAAHGLGEALLEAAVGPDGMRDEALRKDRMEDLVRWTVWLRTREIRAARARLEVEGRPVEKRSFETYYEIEQAHQEATRAS